MVNKKERTSYTSNITSPCKTCNTRKPMWEIGAGRLRCVTCFTQKKEGEQDKRKRSKQDWERGRGAKRKGNPRYKPVIRKGRKVYILRGR